MFCFCSFHLGKSWFRVYARLGLTYNFTAVLCWNIRKHWLVFNYCITNNSWQVKKIKKISCKSAVKLTKIWYKDIKNKEFMQANTAVITVKTLVLRSTSFSSKKKIKIKNYNPSKHICHSSQTISHLGTMGALQCGWVSR